MGRKQQQPRSSGNTKKASAERTASLLSNGGAVPALNAFFPSLSLAAANENETEITVDSDFRLILKKLFKKDAITKLKALEEFITLVGSKSEESLLGVLPFWPRHFSRLGMDIDRRVRETTFEAHRHLCLKVGKHIAPYLKTILAPWLIGRFDSHGPAASAAERSFNEVFPERKHKDVVTFYLTDTIELLRRNLFDISVTTVADSQDLTDEERVIKLVALRCGSLQALRFTLETLLNGVQPDERKVDACTNLINDPKLCQLAKDEHAQVQRYFYELINVSIEKDVLKDLKTITGLTLGRLAGSEDPLTCSAIWQTSVQLVVSHPECWTYLNIGKAVLPQLKNVIRRRGSGSPQSVFQAVLLLYAKMPDDSKWREEILSSLKACLTENVTTQTSVAELSAAAKAFFECLRYEIVHKTANSAGLLQLVENHHLPLLRKMIEFNDAAISRVRPVVFRETHSLLSYFRRNSTENEKYTVFEVVYLEIYSLIIGALDSGQRNPAILLHSHLNHPKEDVQARKSLSFADDGDRQRERAITELATNKCLTELNQKLLSRVLILCSTGTDPSLFKLLGDLFAAYYSADSREFFEKNGFDEPWLLGNLEKWLLERDSVCTGVKMLLTMANSKPEDGVTDIVRMCGEKPQLLLTILEQASECSGETFRPILSTIFHTDAFVNTISNEIEGPRRLEIVGSCLSAPHFFSEFLIEKLMISVIQDIDTVLSDQECDRDKLQLCNAVSKISTSDNSSWRRSSFSTLVFRMYQLSVHTLAEFEEASQLSQAVAKKLQTAWLSAIKADCAPCRECRNLIIQDLKRMIMNPSSADISSVSESVFCLLGDNDGNDDSLLLRQLMPSSEEFDQICLECRVADWVASEKLRQKNYELLILHGDSEFMQEPGHKKIISAFTTLFEICETRNAFHLFDVTHLILIDLIEPQPKFRPVITSLLADDKIVESAARSLCAKDGLHWTTVLDELMGLTAIRLPKKMWQADDCRAAIKWACIKHADTEEDVLSYLSGSPIHTESINELDSTRLCLTMGCVRKAYHEGSRDFLENLASYLKGLLDLRPDQFDTSRPGVSHLAALSFVAFFETYRTHFGGPTENDLNCILSVVEKIVETYPWRDVPSVSNIALATGITLCDLTVQISNLLLSEDELRESFLNVVIEAMVPSFQDESENPWNMPEPLLESVANVYVSLDSSLLADYWTSRDGNASIRDIMAILCGKMQAKQLSLQLSAYALTLSTIIETLNMPEQEHIEESDPHEPIKIDPLLYGFLQDMSSSLAILKKSHGGFLSLEVLDEKDISVLSGYILAMSTTLLFCSHVNTEERSAYFDYVDEQGHWDRYLNLLLEFIPDQPPPNAFVESALPRKFDFTHLVCWAIFDISSRAPGIVKSWYTKLNDTKKENRIKNLMIKYVSPTLIGRELSQAQEASEMSDNMTLSVLNTTREIVARYTLEDIGKTCQVSVLMEPCHPLKPMRISYDPDKVTGSKSMWQNLIRQLNAFLHASNGGIVEALRAWKENLDRKLEGGAECCICYSVLHASTLKLPNYPCMTCKYRFHKACMYKWFSQGNATCPLCRSALG